MVSAAMDCSTTQRRYRSIYKYLRIGAKEYAVLDSQIAAERAASHFAEALRLLDKDTISSSVHEQINRELVLATDFGSKDAPFLLALRILEKNILTDFLDEEVVVFLKTAAERGHAEASYQLGCSYAGISNFPQIERLGTQYFSSFDHNDSARLAEYYLQKAADFDHQDAIEELIIAYAYGRGCIEKSPEGFVNICEQQVKKNNQSVTLGYGSWLLGLTVEGEEPLPEAICLSIDPVRGVEHLLLASQGNNLELAQHALHLICCAIQRERLVINDKFRKRIIRYATAGNQLLSLYLAWYSIPAEQRSNMPKVLENYQLRELSTLTQSSEEDAIAYLNTALFGPDEDISSVSKEILSHVFGRCFMNAEGMLIWE